jgi:hypothetical protein
MGKVIEKITDRMRKIAHVPVQTWKGWNPDNLLGGWFSTIGGFKTMFGAIVIMLGCLVLPCLLPLVMWSIIDPVRSHDRTKNSCTIISVIGLPKSKYNPRG